MTTYFRPHLAALGSQPQAMSRSQHVKDQAYHAGKDLKKSQRGRQHLSVPVVCVLALTSNLLKMPVKFVKEADYSSFQQWAKAFGNEDHGLLALSRPLLSFERLYQQPDGSRIHVRA